MNKKKKLILKKIKKFSGEIHEFIRSSEYIWLVKRIIKFLEHELPQTKKYEEYINDLNNIKEEESRYKDLHIISPFKSNVLSLKGLLKDLIVAVKLDSFESFFIDLHPEVKEVSLKLFKDGHYSEAIFEAVKSLNNFVKKKANITDADLSNAMAKAFNERNPIIKLNNLFTQSDMDEQEGFRFLFQGAMKGIRNPRGHETHKLKDKNEALEYLAFISLLFRKAENGTL